MDIATPSLHGVLYTDGGYLRQYATGGYGIHGYVYEDKESKTGAGMKSGMPGKVGYVAKAALPMEVTPIEYIDGLGAVIEEATNNVAELKGALHALEFALKRQLATLIMVLDSQYVIKAYDLLERWEIQKWVKGDGLPYANRKLLEELLVLKRQAARQGMVITFSWTKGHSGEIGNERADMLATSAMIAAINGVFLDRISAKPAKGYWNTKTDRSRLLNLPRLLSNPRYPDEPAPFPGYCTYAMLQLPRNLPDGFIGKAIPDAQFGVVMLKEADPVLQTLFAVHAEQALKTKYYELGIYFLSEIFRHETYTSISQNGPDFLVADDKRRAVRTIRLGKDKKVQEETPDAETLKEIKEEGLENDIMDTPSGMATLYRALLPVRTAFRAMDMLDRMQQLLVGLLETDGAEASDSLICYTDVTNLIYRMVEKPKSKTVAKLHDEINTLTLSLLLPVKVKVALDTPSQEETLKMSFGLELPDRNTFSAVSGDITRVVVVTWPESEVSVRAATIIQTTEGLGIWTAPYANLHLLHVKKSAVPSP